MLPPTGNNFSTLAEAMNTYNLWLSAHEEASNTIKLELFTNFYKKYLIKCKLNKYFIRSISTKDIQLILEDNQCIGAKIMETGYGYYYYGGSGVSKLVNSLNEELRELDWRAVTSDSFKTKNALVKFNNMLNSVRAIRF